MENSTAQYSTNIYPLIQVQTHVNVECCAHFHENGEFIIVNEGTLTMQINGKVYAIKKGHAAFVPPFITHSFHFEEKNRCQVLVFSNKLIPGFNSFIKTHLPTHYAFPLREEIFSLLNQFLPEQSDTLNAFTTQAALSLLFLEAKEKCAFVASEKLFQESFVQILAYMNEHFADNITLESVARQFFMHAVTLSKLFKENSKTNFNTHLNYLRASHAAFLIRTSTLSFAEIAFQAGFGSIRNFNRIFFKFYGKTPTEYKDF